MPYTKNYDLDTDTTLGGDNASDYVAASQKAIKTYVDNHSGGGGANTDLSNLTATGEAHFQKPLVSGTNIKTVNNKSLLGSGNIDTSEIFIATYGTTTYQEVSAAYRAGKIIKCKFIETTATGSIDELSLVVGNISTGRFLFSGTPNSYGSYKTASLWDGVGWHSHTIIELQKASTAVTHTENTAVGDLATPVYIDSSGTARSTGLSIASSRFDGQWVSSLQRLSSATAISNNSLSTIINSYLPDRNYTYEILCTLFISRNDSSGTNTRAYVYDSTLHTTPSADDDYAFAYLCADGNNFQQANTSFIMIVRPNSTIYYNITAYKLAASNLNAIAYRRVGTNT